MRALWSCLFLCTLTLVACERFEKPYRAQCEQAVKNLVSHSIGAAIDKEFPDKGDDSLEGAATQLLKGVGQGLLTEAMVDEPKLAWCEVHMSLHDANCLRTAQSRDAVEACGFAVNDKGELIKR